MALTIPKQLVTGVLVEPKVSAVVNIPQLQISAVLEKPFLDATISIPMPVFTGTVAAEEPSTLTAAVAVPMQQVASTIEGMQPATISAAIQLPMQLVTASAASEAPSELSGTISVPMPTITALMGELSMSASIGIPMQQLVAEASTTSIDGSISVPMQSVFGLLPEISAVVAVPMQQATGEFWQPLLGVPMQQVTADVAVPLELSGEIAVPMIVFPVYEIANIDSAMPLPKSSMAVISGYLIDAAAPMMTGQANAIIGAAATMDGVLSLARSAVAVDRPSDMVGAFSQIASSFDATTGISVEAVGEFGREIESSISVDEPSAIVGQAPLILSDLSAATGVMAGMTAVAWLVDSDIATTTGIDASINSIAPLAKSSLDADAFATASMGGTAYTARSGFSVTTGIAAHIEATAPAGLASNMQIWLRPTIGMSAAAPMPQSLMHASLAAQSVTLLAMGLRKAAVTELQSAIGIESVAELDGVVYVAGPSGVFAMTGATDDGTPFNKSALLAMLDFGAGQKKHPEACLMEADASTPPSLTVRSTGGVNTYPFAGPKRGSMYRAKIGRGITGKRLQFELSGAGINSVESLDFAVEPGKRSF